MSGAPTNVGFMFDPWRIISANPWIQVHQVQMPEGKPGATNGKDTIWLDRRMTARERRCVLTHELVHMQYEHMDCQPPKMERRVRTETAHLLIAWPDLARAEHVDTASLAEDLHVTAQVLEDRLVSLSVLEVDLLRDRGVTISTDVSW